MKHVFLQIVIVASFISAPSLAKTKISPPEATGTSRSPEIRTTQILIPVSVPIPLLAVLAEEKTPRSDSGNKRLNNFGPASNNTVNYNFARSPLVVAGGNNWLTISGTVSGTVRVTGRIKPIRGTVGKLLGNVNPSVPYSQSLRLKGNVQAQIEPRLQENWRVIPNISGSVALTEATARIANVFNLSLRDALQGDVNNSVNREIARLNSQIADDPFLENLAKDVWKEICRPIQIKMEETTLFLHLTPRQFHATQPTITEKELVMGLGLEAETHINEIAERPATCPPFNQALRITSELGKTSALQVSSSLSYDSLNEQLANLFEKPMKVDRAGIKVIFAQIAGHGDRLLLTVDADFEHIGWFWDDVKRQRVFVVAKPVLDIKQQTLKFQEVKLSVASKSIVGELFSTLAGSFAPLLENRIEELTIDLKPEIEKAKARVSAARADLVGKTGSVSITTLELDDLAVRGLWHDKHGIHIAIEAMVRIAARFAAFDNWPPN